MDRVLESACVSTLFHQMWCMFVTNYKKQKSKSERTRCGTHHGYLETE
jgi:hypothetical protein